MEDWGIAEFNDKLSYSLGVLLEFLRAFLLFLLVELNGIMFTQKEEICIASCVAPTLSDLSMASCDRAIEACIDNLE